LIKIWGEIFTVVVSGFSPRHTARAILFLYMNIAILFVFSYLNRSMIKICAAILFNIKMARAISFISVRFNIANIFPYLNRSLVVD
jgi:hypothetical protein